MMAADPFDNRDGYIWYDGRLVPWREARIHVLTHALHYASAVFEGERVYGGTIFKLRDHTERLINSARILGFEIPWGAEEIDRACYEVVRAQKLTDAYVRPIAWRGPEQMGVAAQATKIHMAIAAWEWPSYFAPEARLKGIRMMWSEWARPAPNTAPTESKAAGLYMICTLAKHTAEAKGYDDAMMLDWRGQVAEATGANIFLVIKGEIHTPTPDCFLDGITRKTVIELARKRGLKVIERAIWPDEFAKTDEVFITGTAAEVTPVSEIGQYRFTPGKVCHALIEDFDRLIGRAPAKASAA
jgi:branched-chain amino acid aminotransferase